METLSLKIDSHKTNPKDVIGSKNIDFTKIIAFDNNGCILTLITENGVSLPCGRVEGWDNRDAFDAAHREAWETANVTLGTLITLNIIETQTSQGDLRKTLVLAARIARKDPMRKGQAPRLFLKAEDFIKHYSNDIKVHQQLTKTAVESITELQPNYLEDVKKKLCLLEGGAK